MDMREMRALIEKGFEELNDKFDQSILDIKQSIQSSKAHKKGKGLKQSPNVNASNASYGNSSTPQTELPTEDKKTVHVTRKKEEEIDMSISMDAAVEYDDKGIQKSGYHGKRPLKILIGFGGSTHNFINETLADELGCDIYPIKPHTVSFAFGKMVTSRVCKNFQLSLQGVMFNVKLYLLPMSSNCDMVLGNQWISTLQDFTFLSTGFEFYFRGKKHFIRFNKPVDEGSSKG